MAARRRDALVPALPRGVWIVQGATFVTWLGNGAVAPFLLVYLHDVRGLPIGTAGLVVAATSVGALGAAPVAGALADRLGPRTVLFASLLGGAATAALFPWARSPWEAALLLALAGVAGAAFGTSQPTLVAALTAPGSRRTAFAVQRVSIHLGIGLGALAGGVLVSVAEPESFTTLFRLNALSFLLSALCVLALPATRPPAAVARAGYLDVLRDRAFVGFLLVNSLVIAGAIVPMGTFLPLFALDAGVSAAEVGSLLLLGSFLVVTAQLPIAGLLAGRRRMSALALMAALWSGALLAVPLATVLGREAALAVLAAVIVFYAIGQCLHGAVQNPLTADLGEGRAPGRYMGMLNLSWQVSLAIGPALGGLVVAAEPAALWLLGALACLLAAGLALALDLAPSSPLRGARAAEATA